MDVGRFSGLIRRRWPQIGNFIARDGGTENFADSMRVDASYASAHNNMFRAWWGGVVPASTTYHFAIDIPTGLDLYGFGRIHTVRNGSIYPTMFVRATPGAVQETIDGFKFDEREGEVLSQAKLLRVDSLTGGDVRSPTIPVVTDDTGADIRKRPVSQTELDLRPVFNAANPPSFSYQNQLTSDVDFWLELFWLEREPAT